MKLDLNDDTMCREHVWCHNHYMKRVGCNSYVETNKAMTLKWRSSNHTRVKTYECHNESEEDCASSNTPYNMCIEEKTRHEQDRATSRQECQR